MLLVWASGRATELYAHSARRSIGCFGLSGEHRPDALTMSPCCSNPKPTSILDATSTTSSSRWGPYNDAHLLSCQEACMQVLP